MSLLTDVFEDGRWVVRNMDPHHLRAQNMEHVEGIEFISSRPCEPPTLGILTRTLVRSPALKWILPARVRHQTKNDVVFITNDSVTIKEARSDYSLEHIAIKTDFDSEIRSARIIGGPRKLTSSEISTEDHGLKYSVNANRIERLERPVLPPQILTLALKSNNIVFLILSDDSNNPTWLSSQKKVPVGANHLEDLGEHMAVDPKSRAMAIASYSGCVYIYALKSMEFLEQELGQDSKFEPIKEERLLPGFPASGIILKMEFLHSSEADPAHIILVLIVSVHGRSRVLWYVWNTMAERITLDGPKSRLLLPEESIPLLLIPLRLHFTAFLLIYHKHVTIYKDFSSGRPERYIQHLDCAENSEEPGNSSRAPIWTHWARPMRHQTYNAPFTRGFDDAIYLCREDGLVQYVTLSNDLDHLLDNTHPAGRLGAAVNAAFAALDVGLQTEDLLAAGGTTSEGGLWRFGPRLDPLRMAKVSNWTPLNYFTATRNFDDEPSISIPNAGLRVSFPGEERLFACTGKGKYGAITELRYGLEASKVSETVDLGDTIGSGILNMWAFHAIQKQSNVFHVIITHPTRTSLLRMRLEYNTDLSVMKGYDPELVTEDLGLDFGTRTLIAGTMAGGGIIQVTDTAIRVTASPILGIQNLKEETGDEVRTRHLVPTNGQAHGPWVHVFDSYQVLAASTLMSSREIIGSSGSSQQTFALLALQEEQTFRIQFARLRAERYESISEIIALHSQPACLLLAEITDGFMALMGTLDRVLHLMICSWPGLSLRKVDQFAFSDPFAVCDSLAITMQGSNDNVQRPTVLICGLRNGTVATFDLNLQKQSLTLREEIKLGHTSVKVMRDVNCDYRAIIQGDKMLCALEYSEAIDAPASIRKIWITDDEQPALHTGSLALVAQAKDFEATESTPGRLSGSLFCIDKDLLHTVLLAPKAQPGVVPRHMQIRGRPFRVMKSTHMNKLIVLYNETITFKKPITDLIGDRDPSQGHAGRRLLHPRIAFIDPDDVPEIKADPDEMDVESDNSSVLDLNEIETEREQAERFLGVTEWNPEVNGSISHLLVINTLLPRANKTPIGRMLIFTMTWTSENPLFMLKTKIVTDKPVYCVASYSKSSLVFCCGDELRMLNLSRNGPFRTAQTQVKVGMRSPGRSLTVSEPMIFVSSAGESLLAYEYIVPNHSSGEDGKLVYRSGALRAAKGLHHLYVPELSLILATDMNRSVYGYHMLEQEEIREEFTEVFEAELPSSITHLERISLPLWYDLKGDEQIQDAIIGSSADGAITQFTIIGKGWKLLKFIQNMAERHPLICPFRDWHTSSVEPMAARELDTLTPVDDRAHGERMHINGDIVQRVMERGEPMLRELLEMDVDPRHMMGFRSVEERHERFKIICEEVKHVRAREEGWLGRVVEWVRFHLRDVL